MRLAAPIHESVFGQVAATCATESGFELGSWVSSRGIVTGAAISLHDNRNNHIFFRLSAKLTSTPATAGPVLATPIF